MTTATEAGTLVPTEQPMTAAQAVASVEAKLDALVTFRLAEFEKDLAEIAADAAFLEPVTDDEGAELAADRHKRARGVEKELEEARKAITGRLDDLKKRVKGPFDKKQLICANAAAAHKENARPYLEEKDRKAEQERLRALEVKRKAEEQARKEQEEKRLEAERKQREADEARRKEEAAKAEADRLEREREQARTKKAREEADAKLAQARLAQTQAEEDAAAKADEATEAAIDSTVADEVAEAAAAPLDIKTQSAGVRSVGGASLGLQKVWQHKVVDEALLPAEAWSINHDWIADQYKNEEARAKIADENGVPQVPGCLIFRAPRVAGR